MKKLTKKLLLSAITLGLALVTLTTTTFAWYTTSTTATATGSGSTSGETSDSTLLISKDYDSLNPSTATWEKKVTLSSVTSLKPVAWNKDSKTFVNMSGTEEGVSNTDYYQFKLAFKTTKSTIGDPIAVYLNSLKISNSVATDGALPTYDNLLATQTGKGTLTANTYAVDVVRALDMVVQSGSNAVGYELSGQFNYATGKESGISESSNAMTYYDGVMGGNSSVPTTSLLNAVSVSKSGSTIGEITVTNEGVTNYVNIGSITADSDGYLVLEVTFTIFLNGWDQYCFDACKGQSFSVELGFTTKAKSA